MRGSGQEVILVRLIEEYIKKETFNFVGVGVWSGLTAQFLLKEFPEINYYGVDPYLAEYSPKQTTQEQLVKAYRLAVERIGPYDNAQIIEVASVEASYLFEDNTIDVVFIDANHDYGPCLADIRAWWPKTLTLMTGHDYLEDDRNGVRPTVETFCKKRGVEYHIGASRIWYIPK